MEIQFNAKLFTQKVDTDDIYSVTPVFKKYGLRITPILRIQFSTITIEAEYTDVESLYKDLNNVMLGWYPELSNKENE